MRRHVFISPHLDDAVLSAADYIFQLKKKKEKIFIITVFTEFGKEPISRDSQEYIRCCGLSDLKRFSQERKKEDIKAMERLGVKYSHLGFVDGGFRKRKRSSFLNNILAHLGIGFKFIYPTKKALFSGKISSFDRPLFKEISLKLKKIIKADDILYGPLAIGNHTDHLIIRNVFSHFSNKKYYWVDQPYINEKKNQRQSKNLLKNYKKAFEIKQNMKKMEVFKCYTSQIKCLFGDKINLKKEAFYEKSIKIALITSRGGHLFQLYSLKEWWQRYDRFWITGRGEDSDYLLRNEKVYYGFFPEHRNLLNALRNFFLGFKILSGEKPDLLVSTGSGIAPPVFLAGKILGCELIYIDSYSFVKYPSLSARLTAPLVDKLLIQHPKVKRFFRKAEYWGAII